jgi:hypothetical protein
MLGINEVEDWWGISREDVFLVYAWAYEEGLHCHKDSVIRVWDFTEVKESDPWHRKPKVVEDQGGAPSIQVYIWFTHEEYWAWAEGKKEENWRALGLHQEQGRISTAKDWAPKAQLRYRWSSCKWEQRFLWAQNEREPLHLETLERFHEKEDGEGDEELKHHWWGFQGN